MVFESEANHGAERKGGRTDGGRERGQRAECLIVMLSSLKRAGQVL